MIPCVYRIRINHSARNIVSKEIKVRNIVSKDFESRGSNVYSIVEYNYSRNICIDRVELQFLNRELSKAIASLHMDGSCLKHADLPFSCTAATQSSGTLFCARNLVNTLELRLRAAFFPPLLLPIWAIFPPHVSSV